MRLSDYRRKRRFGQGRKRQGTDGGPCFVIQHQAARGDHYDFRLEIDGVLVSWAIPNGPSTNPRDRRMARRTEDHPLDHASFEDVIVWDRGTYSNATIYEMAEGLERGHLSFRLHGEKLKDGYALTRIREGEEETWLLIKRRGGDTDSRFKPVLRRPESVLSGRTPDDLDESP